jgi:hypothetical protein
MLLQNATLAVGQTNVTLYPIADGYADSKYPKMTYSARTTFLYVGNSYDREQNIWGSERVYIRFDLADLAKNHVILQATLRLWQYYAPKSDQTYEAHRVLSKWSEATLSWTDQPSWAPKETSETVAPPQTEVAVEWDITSDVKAWYTGEAPNYGTMIKVAKEEQASEASSGFWSREYPVGPHEQWRPRLVVAIQGEPTMVYTVTVSVTGLPNALSADVSVDGQPYKSLSSARDIKIAFDRGTTHTIAASKLVLGPPGVRYMCDTNQTNVSNATSQVFIYATEYLVNITSEPNGILDMPQFGWYRSGASLSVKPTGGDVVYTTQGTRLVFDAWYMNDRRLTTEPTAMIVSEPIRLEARYGTEYYLNVTSPFGITTGSGWYKKDTTAPFSVDTALLPAPGSLGVLGLRKSFDGWVGSQNFLGTQQEIHGAIVMREPATITAIWSDDWTALMLNVLVILFAAIVGGTVLVMSRRKVWRKDRMD